jgi:hypothetical protein
MTRMLSKRVEVEVNKNLREINVNEFAWVSRQT